MKRESFVTLYLEGMNFNGFDTCYVTGTDAITINKNASRQGVAIGLVVAAAQKENLR